MAYFIYNTLDIDTTERERVNQIIGKIMQCPYLDDLEVEPSFQKGVHVKMWCMKECEMCRLVFDDEIRYAYDQYRPKYSQNVLFNEKKILKVKKGEKLKDVS